MVEIRTIRHEEAESFLRVVCESFDLDFGNARTVFFTEPYFDLNRKWALFEGDEIQSVLTVTPLHFGWGDAVGIAGVATRPSARRSGLAAKLLEHVLRIEPRAMLFAKDERLYDRMGFQTVDQVVRSSMVVDDQWETLEPLAVEEVFRIYTRWSEEHPNRLRRDDLRWRHWNWHYRACASFGDGYLTSEPGILREAIFSTPVSHLPLPLGAEWFGFQSIADDLSLSLLFPTHDLYVMTLNCPKPQMFMTDQF